MPGVFSNGVGRPVELNHEHMIGRKRFALSIGHRNCTGSTTPRRRHSIMFRKVLARTTSRTTLHSQRSFQTSSALRRVVATNPVKAEEVAVSSTCFVRERS